MKKSFKIILLIVIAVAVAAAALAIYIPKHKEALAEKARIEAENAAKAENREKFPEVYEYIEGYLTERYSPDVISVENVEDAYAKGLYNIALKSGLLGEFKIMGAINKIHDDPYFDLYLTREIEQIVSPFAKTFIGDYYQIKPDAALTNSQSYTSMKDVPDIKALAKSQEYSLSIEMQLYKDRSQKDLTYEEASQIADFCNALLNEGLDRTFLYISFGTKVGTGGFKQSQSEDIHFILNLRDMQDLQPENIYAASKP